MIFIDFIKATMAQTGNAPEKFKYLAMKNSSAIYKNWRAKNPEKAWAISQYVEKIGQKHSMWVFCQVILYMLDFTFYTKSKPDIYYLL